MERLYWSSSFILFRFYLVQRFIKGDCQNTMRILVLLIITLFIGGCSKDIDLGQDQEFLHALVPNQQACEQIQQSSIVFNCFQVVRFIGGHQAEVVVTDIVNRGQYKKKGNKIIIKFEDNYDVPELMEFEIVNDNTLRYEGADFKRWKGPTAWEFY
jgi:hypothetical protein